MPGTSRAATIIQDSTSGYTMEFYVQSVEGDKLYSTDFTEVYYRPFVYGTRPRFLRWGKRFWKNLTKNCHLYIMGICPFRIVSKEKEYVAKT